MHGDFTKKCYVCFKEFHTTRANVTICSDECSIVRYKQRKAKPSKYNGSFLNETSFNKAWEEAKEKFIWREENVEVQKNWKNTI